MLTDEQITTFQKLYERRFGTGISRDEARESGMKLVRLMKIIHQPTMKQKGAYHAPHHSRTRDRRSTY